LSPPVTVKLKRQLRNQKTQPQKTFSLLSLSLSFSNYPPPKKQPLFAAATNDVTSGIARHGKVRRRRSLSCFFFRKTLGPSLSLSLTSSPCSFSVSSPTTKSTSFMFCFSKNTGALVISHLLSSPPPNYKTDLRLPLDHRQRRLDRRVPDRQAQRHRLRQLHDRRRQPQRVRAGLWRRHRRRRGRLGPGPARVRRRLQHRGQKAGRRRVRRQLPDRRLHGLRRLRRGPQRRLGRLPGPEGCPRVRRDAGRGRRRRRCRRRLRVRAGGQGHLWMRADCLSRFEV